MASSFFGIEIAKTGLFMSQKQLNLTGHNISNVNTAGYTRQRIISQSIDPHGVMMRWAPMENGRVGGGVRLQTLERIRDSFIDREIRRENAAGGKLAMQEDTLLYIESIFNETSSASLSKALAEFINSFQNLQANTASAALRTDVRTKTITFTETLHVYYKKLEETQKSMDENMKETSSRINDLLDMITDFDKQIYRYEISGEKANDLRDKRDMLLDELSTLIDIRYEEVDGKLKVTTSSGQPLVNHADAYHLSAVKNAATGFVDIFLVNRDDHSAVVDALNYSGGEMEGYRRMRDGNTTNDYGIPYIMQQLDDLAKGLVDAINLQHRQGWTYPNDGNASTNGVDFFEIEAGKSAAQGIKISQAIEDDPFNIACSSIPVTTNNVDDPTGDNENLLAILKLIANENITAISGTSFEGYLKNIITEIGSQSSKIQTLYDTQLSIMLNLETKRQSISGVSMEEEITLMMQYQHMYAANSRMLTALDEALDVLINRTGKVGL